MKRRNKFTLLIALCTLFAGLVLGWIFFGRSPDSFTPEGTGNEQEEITNIWTCSMHPQIKQNEPGDCPICGMELIPLSNSHSVLDPDAIRMSATAMELAKVRTMKVGGLDDINRNIQLFGKVKPNEESMVTQTAHFSGRVEKLMVSTTGEIVQRGQELAKIYSPDLVLAQKELMESVRIQDFNPDLAKAAREKLKNWKLTDQQIDMILSNDAPIEQFPLLADQKGVVMKKLINLGDYISEGSALYQIADLSSLWVLFDVYESDLERVTTGDTVNYQLRSVPGKTFQGVISFVDPVIDPVTRVAHARVVVPNSKDKLKPGMFAEGVLKAPGNKESSEIMVPKSAVMWTGKRSVVYIMHQDEEGVSFKMREVTLGPEMGEAYIIESGLFDGEEIAVNGTFSIDAAAQLAGKPSMMNPEGGKTMTGHNHGDHQAMDNGMGQISVSAESKDALVPLFETYFKMKYALANDDFPRALEAGLRLNKEVEEIDMTAFRGTAHSLWMQQYSALKKSTEQIHNESDIKELRSNFIEISKSIIGIAEAFEPFSSPVYVQHCPMADENNGADWLSREKEIFNPYFGEAMLSCGSVVKTIQ